MIACPNCGKENQDHYKFCLGCGSDLPRAEQSEAPKSMTPPTGIPAVSDPVAATVASAAGAVGPAADADPVSPTAYAQDTAPPSSVPPSTVSSEIIEQPAASASQPEAPDGPVVCSSCGTAIPPGFAFCGACGTPVSGSQPSGGGATSATEAVGDGVARLVLIQPDGTEGGHVEIPGSEVAVGRDAGGFFGNDPFLSPTHAIFCTTSSGVTIKDAGSLNGTYVKVTPNEPVEIQSGAIFRMGQELILFEGIDKGSDAPDGTAIMGSPIKGLWGRVALIIGEGTLGNAFTIAGDGIVLGRERGDIIFPEDGYVSGIHVRLYQDKGKFYMNDLGSSNGTFLKLTGEQVLTNGSFLLMGQQLFRIDV